MDVHDIMGYDRCANPDCLIYLSLGHVTLITTTHVRRFCDVECITKGKEIADQIIYDSAMSGRDSSQELLDYLKRRGALSIR